MSNEVKEPPSFERRDPPGRAGPVVVAVPHAGRDYAPALIERSRLEAGWLAQLEDRHADALIDDTIAAGAVAIVATRPRAWIDLNRDEREIDPTMLTGRVPAGELISTVKSRGGLGLIPRRIQGGGEIWRRPLSIDEVAARISSDHRPYHAAVAAALAEARRRHGCAALIDCHSMPPVQRPGQVPQVVIGDRFGASAAGRFTERAIAEAEAMGLRAARNDPYAGGHTLDRHGSPRRDIHAIQIEVDRSLYLTPDRARPGAGLSMVRRLVARIAAALAAECAATWPLAAE